jgi:hypothetical protein
MNFVARGEVSWTNSGNTRRTLDKFNAKNAANAADL